MVHCNKKDINKISETISCENGNEENIIKPTASAEQTTKKTYSDKLSVTEESKKQKGNLSDNTTKNT